LTMHPYFPYIDVHLLCVSHPPQWDKTRKR
jgi:hypothetical protein